MSVPKKQEIINLEWVRQNILPKHHYLTKFVEQERFAEGWLSGYNCSLEVSVKEVDRLNEEIDKLECETSDLYERLRLLTSRTLRENFKGFRHQRRK